MKTKHFGAIVLACLLPIVVIAFSSFACTTAGKSSGLGDSAGSGDDKGAEMNDQKKSSGAPVPSGLVSANTRFGFKLYQEVIGDSAGENVFVSPSSIAIALAMTYNGAEGETRKAMARALELEGMDLDRINREYALLRASLESPDPKVQLQIANSLWARLGTPFKKAFMERNREFYGAEIAELDFGDPAASGTINGWVSRNTKGKINQIVDQIDPNAVLFLINAIYFKGAWTAEFDKAKTSDGTFYLGGGKEKKHPMMNQSGRYDYYENEAFQAVSLPYGEERVSMYVFLPRKGSGLDEFHRMLKASDWDRWMSEFERLKGEIVLPRFKVEYEVDLNDALKALGMEIAFDSGRANFSGLLESVQNAFINKVKHKTFCEVNEEGTEAAAVTSVEVQVTALPRPEKTFRMVVDRPFFCAIRDNQTGTVLFMGSIVDPR